MAINLPYFEKDFNAQQLPEHEWCLGSVKMGYDATTSCLATAPLKEYTMGMSLGLSQALLRKDETILSNSSSEFSGFLEQISHLMCSSFEMDCWLPDYNPHGR